MSPIRRLHGIAALSAAALATAGVAGQGIAADECTDTECLLDQLGTQLIPTDGSPLSENVSLDFIRSMLEAQGLPPETIEQTMAIYEQMAGLGAGGGSGKASDLTELMAAFGGEEIPEDALLKFDELADMYAQLGILSPGQDLNDLFAKATPGDDQTNEIADAWPAKWYSDLPELMAAYGGEEIPEEVLVKLGDMYAQLGIDPEGLFASLDEAVVINHEEQYVQPSGALDEVFAKVEYDADTFVKLGGALTVAEAALAQAAADGDIDQATLDVILGMLPDE